MKIGILGTADIAFRRFLPALIQCGEFTYAGVASRTPGKGKPFQEKFGGEIYDSYDALLADESIEAVYLPLPPALHYMWGKKALEAGKHILMEKPFTTGLSHTKELLELAEEQGLAVHENYMFLYHSQIERIREIAASGDLGELRLIRTAFGFPLRGVQDFRYNKDLGGGAILDCGGYPIRLAAELLGESAKLTQSVLCQPKGYEVDLFGSAVMENSEGLCAQISFGMDNAYQCKLELWGSKAMLTAPRVFTAPPDLSPVVEIDGKTVSLPADNSFANSIKKFRRKIGTPSEERDVSPILRQAEMIETVQKGRKI